MLQLFVQKPLETECLEVKFWASFSPTLSIERTFGSFTSGPAVVGTLWEGF